MTTDTLPTTDAALRVDHRTVERPAGYEGPPVGLAARDGVCPDCGQEVDENEPLLLVGQMIEQSPEGSRSIDLTGAYWICQKGYRP